MGILWELFGAVSPYAKIVEYGVILTTVGLGIFAARRLKDGSRDMRDVIERLKAQAQEAVGDLDAAIGRMQARQVEDEDEEQAVDADGPGGAEDEAAVEAERQAELQAHAEWWRPVTDMKFTDPDQPQPKLYWKNNVRARLPWHGTWLTGWHNDSPDGVCGVAVSGKGPRIDALWRKIRSQAAELESELPEGATVEPGRFGIGIMRQNAEFRDDDERRAWLISNLDHFARVLGPRMKALVEKRS